MEKLARRVPEELRELLTKDLPKDQDKVILAFDNLCKEFMEDWDGPETYQNYLEKQLQLISDGGFSSKEISSSESVIHKKPSDGNNSLTHHLMMALTYRILAEDLEEEGLIFDSNQAITSAALHLGACIPSLFIEIGKKIDISEKNSATAVKRHQNSRSSIDYFSKLIRELAPQDGWKSRKQIIRDATPSLAKFEAEIGLNLPGDTYLRLMRWMRKEESPKQAVSETLKKKTNNNHSK